MLQHMFVYFSLLNQPEAPHANHFWTAQQPPLWRSWMRQDWGWGMRAEPAWCDGSAQSPSATACSVLTGLSGSGGAPRGYTRSFFLRSWISALLFTAFIRGTQKLGWSLMPSCAVAGGWRPGSEEGPAPPTVGASRSVGQHLMFCVANNSTLHREVRFGATLFLIPWNNLLHHISFYSLRAH